MQRASGKRCQLLHGASAIPNSRRENRPIKYNKPLYSIESRLTCYWTDFSRVQRPNFALPVIHEVCLWISLASKCTVCYHSCLLIVYWYVLSAIAQPWCGWPDSISFCSTSFVQTSCPTIRNNVKALKRFMQREGRTLYVKSLTV
jgi:hypothetical protein